MYSSRGGNPYGQQSHGAQSGLNQNPGSIFTGSSGVGPDGNSKHSLVSRHSTIGSASLDADISAAYRGQASSASQYGGQYSSFYGSASLGSGQQASTISSKPSGQSTLEGHNGYPITMLGSPKFTSGDYLSSSSLGYSHKADQFLSEKLPDYPSLERRQYGERESSYLGRDLQSELGGRFSDSAGFSHQHEKDLYERVERASLLRQEQMLKAQSLQTASLDGGSRHADYLAARGAVIRNSTQELLSYGGRIDPDPRGLSILSGSSYNGQPAPSILGAAPRSVEDLMYARNSSNPGYGVSLPPGRDYATGKGLHVQSLESDYPTSLLSRGGHSRIDDPRDDLSKYALELELKEEERRREKLREREREREREKDRQREREHERERERDRERERERDRERERERQRERERRRRDRERERKREFEAKRALEAKRDNTPSKVSKDQSEASLNKDSKSSRQVSPRRDSLHRRPSPFKEKRRDYVCKVHSSSIVDVERDYLSLDKRYPRLVISPEFSKVVVNWPRENLKISLNTPVSFEHGFIESNVTEKKQPSVILDQEQLKSKEDHTVWVAKMILMSGLSQKALEDLSSERSFDDRVPHICNILRFAFLKKEHSFLAIGGPWDSIDGGDPAVDDSSLVQTVLRYAKDVTQLDLKSCQHWNRFLEIHYDRVGKDGLFSHKEVTVLFIPDLSECLPSMDLWRNQWLAHMKAITERERKLSLEKEKTREKPIVSKGKETINGEDIKDVGKTGKRKDSVTRVKATDNKMKSKDGNELTKSPADKSGGKEIKGEKEEITPPASVASGSATNSGKKKIIKKIVKQKGAVKKEDITEAEAKVLAEGQSATLDATLQINVDNTGPSVVKPLVVKKTIKRKIIKRVPKRKAIDSTFGDGVSEKTNDVDKNENDVSPLNKEISTEKITGAEKQGDDTERSEVKYVPKTVNADKQENVANPSKVEIKDGEKSVVGMKKETEPAKENDSPKGHTNENKEKAKDKVTGEAEKEKRDIEGKEEAKTKSSKDTKEQRRLEPPRPGFILQTKGDKESKLRSLSLSLDSLLEYTDKDLEESTFELSLFAESFYEMLQYQMGSRLLEFLQKLRIKFVTKRNQRKREREAVEKEDKVTPSKRPKIIGTPVKTSELPTKHMPANSESLDAVADDKYEVEKEKQVSAADEETEKEAVLESLGAAVLDDKNNAEKEKQASAADVENEKEAAVANVEEENVDNDNLTDVDEDPEEDPEEEPEEDEDMEDANPQHDSSTQENEEKKSNVDSEPAVINENEKENANEAANISRDDTKLKPEADTIEQKLDTDTDAKRKESRVVPEVVDKELLKAFRFFDRNRVGFIRVEDLRLILHSLKKFLSHRDVKELVQSALLESNTGRDDRILYKKLVRMTDL